MRQAFLFLSFLLLITSCGKPKMEDTANLNITFKATYDGEPLIVNQKDYDYLGKSIRFTRIGFYMANPTLSSQEGNTKISEIEFIDITKTHFSEVSAEQGTIIEFTDVPIGEYSELKLDVGVPLELNQTTPTDYKENHPLGIGNSDFFSEAEGGYIFAKIEGEYDTDGEKIEFAYHSITNQEYQSLQLGNLINLKAEEISNINLELDIKQLFTIPDGNLLFLHPTESTNPNYRAVVLVIMNNFEEALQIKNK